MDDILYDYIRRPDGPLDTMKFPGLKGGAQASIVSFLGEARDRLDPTGAFLGASLFGIAAFRPEDVAQDVPRIARNVDYIAPLIYPSHWGPGVFGHRPRRAAGHRRVAEGPFTSWWRAPAPAWCLAPGLLAARPTAPRRSARRSRAPRPRAWTSGSCGTPTSPTRTAACLGLSAARVRSQAHQREQVSPARSVSNWRARRSAGRRSTWRTSTSKCSAQRLEDALGGRRRRRRPCSSNSRARHRPSSPASRTAQASGAGGVEDRLHARRRAPISTDASTTSPSRQRGRRRPQRRDQRADQVHLGASRYTSRPSRFARRSAAGDLERLDLEEHEAGRRAAATTTTAPQGAAHGAATAPALTARPTTASAARRRHRRKFGAKVADGSRSRSRSRTTSSSSLPAAAASSSPRPAGRARARRRRWIKISARSPKPLRGRGGTPGPGSPAGGRRVAVPSAPATSPATSRSVPRFALHEEVGPPPRPARRRLSGLQALLGLSIRSTRTTWSASSTDQGDFSRTGISS